LEFKQSGKLRSVWDVDGKIFLSIWGLVKAYADKSARKSLSHSGDLDNRDLDVPNYEMVEDLMADIRCQLFYTLRFYGPTPGGVGFGGVISLITLNVLSRKFSKRHHMSRKIMWNKETKTSEVVSKKSTHISKISFQGNEGEALVKNGLSYTDVSFEKAEILLSVPAEFRRVVELVLEGALLDTARKECGINRQDGYKMQKVLRNVFSDYRNTRKESSCQS
jgi:hypothetical protein